MYKLTRIEDNLEKVYPTVKFVSFDELGRGRELKDIPEVDTSCILGPFGPAFTWQTTSIKSITLLEFKEDGLVSNMRFTTLNSKYKLEWVE